MELHEVCHARRRRLAGELEVVLAHPVIAPLLVEFGHHREVVDDLLRHARRPQFFTPLGSWRVAIADCPAERLGEYARVVVQVGRFRPGQIVDVTYVRRRVVEDRRDRASDSTCLMFFPAQPLDQDEFGSARKSAFPEPPPVCVAASDVNIQK